MKRILAAAALAALLALPGASAVISTSDQFVIVHAAVQVVNVVVPFEPAYPDVPVWYIDDDGSVWMESNGVPGLQTAPVTDEAGAEVAPADTYLAGFASIPPL